MSCALMRLQSVFKQNVNNYYMLTYHIALEVASLKTGTDPIAEINFNTYDGNSL
jgi:hypothetical protein